MRLSTYLLDGHVVSGVLRDDGLVDVSTRSPELSSIRTILAAGALDEVRALAESVTEADRALDDVVLLPVIPDPGKIVCAGVNYHEHRAESGRDDAGPEQPVHPTLFTRFADSQMGHGESALRPASSDRLDYEGELAVIIGVGGRQIDAGTAMDHVAGYACYNDFSVRDWQWRTSQWLPGKNFPGTGGFGPAMVTVDEVADVDALRLQTRVNGEVRQSAVLADLIFSIPELIAYVSAFTPLGVGDVIVTGTPGGVGAFRDPPQFLDVGDVVEVEIDGIGLLRNVVASG